MATPVLGRPASCMSRDDTREPQAVPTTCPIEETVVAARSGVGAVDDDGRGDAPVRLALSA